MPKLTISIRERKKIKVRILFNDSGIEYTTVYSADQIAVNGKTWHRGLFKDPLLVTNKVMNLDTNKPLIEVSAIRHSRSFVRELWIVRIAMTISCITLLLAILNTGSRMSLLMLFLFVITGTVIVIYILKRLRKISNST